METRLLDADAAVQDLFELHRLLRCQRGTQDRAAKAAEPPGDHFGIARLNPGEDVKAHGNEIVHDGSFDLRGTNRTFDVKRVELLGACLVWPTYHTLSGVGLFDVSLGFSLRFRRAEGHQNALVGSEIHLVFEGMFLGMPRL